MHDMQTEKRAWFVIEQAHAELTDGLAIELVFAWEETRYAIYDGEDADIGGEG